MRRISVFAAFASVMLTSCMCRVRCTPLEVIIEATGGSLDPGAYVLTVEHDDNLATCRIEISRPQEATCDQLGLSLVHWAQALYLRFEDGYPKAISLTLEKDGTTIAQKAITPTYAKTTSVCGSCVSAAVENWSL